uniref:Putative salivary lipocalin n=1 Tax=Ixodes ricinus TaxID=34613 RepID=A0A0K8R984_IXORI
MAVQLSTVCYVIIGAIIIFPEAHSKPYQTTYDAAREISITKRYYLKYRSYLNDRIIRGADHCVSLLVTINRYGVSDAIFRYKLTPRGDYNSKLVELRTHKSPPQSTRDNMITTTEKDTGRQLYVQRLQYSDYQHCRVLVQEFQNGRECSLWLSPERRRGPVPSPCRTAYTDICQDRVHNIDDPAHCP